MLKGYNDRDVVNCFQNCIFEISETSTGADTYKTASL